MNLATKGRAAGIFGGGALVAAAFSAAAQSPFVGTYVHGPGSQDAYTLPVGCSPSSMRIGDIVISVDGKVAIPSIGLEGIVDASGKIEGRRPRDPVYFSIHWYGTVDLTGKATISHPRGDGSGHCVSTDIFFKNGR